MGKKLTFEPEVDVEWVVDYFPPDVMDYYEKQLKRLIKEIFECCLLSKYYKVERGLKDDVAISIWIDIEKNSPARDYAAPLIAISYEPIKKFMATLESSETKGEIWAYIHIKPLGTVDEKEDKEAMKLILKALGYKGSPDDIL